MRLKILLPTDFSKNAWHAINYALKLYKNDAFGVWQKTKITDRL